MSSIYIAGKGKKAEDRVKTLSKRLTDLGHKITFDWTRITVDLPYKDYPEDWSISAGQMISAILRSDIVVVLLDDNGLGMHVETGVALGSFMTWGRVRRVYIVGEKNDQSSFYFLPVVRRMFHEDAVVEDIQSRPLPIV